MQSENNEFICPECGSDEAANLIMATIVYDPQDRWSGVLQRITCAECHFTIPAHLALRWDDISPAQAQQEWRQIFRATAPKWD